MLRRNLLIYGVGGLIIPFIGIWAHRPHHPVHPRIRWVICDMNRLPSIVRQHIAALRALLVFTVLCGIIYPVVMFGRRPGGLPQPGQRLAGQLPTAAPSAPACSARSSWTPRATRCRSTSSRGRPHAINASGPKTDYGCDPLFSAASNLGPNNPALVQPDQAAAEADRGVRPRQDLADPAGRGDRVGLGPRSRTSRRRTPPSRWTAWRRPGTSARPRSRRWSASTPRAVRSGSSASRG